jgi:hypothetical protein
VLNYLPQNTLDPKPNTMKRKIHITSYFSFPTDLAAEMRDWPEFVAGQDYSVDLKNPNSGETVSVRYVEKGEEHYVAVIGDGAGTLFDRVLGRVIYALSAHSDHLMVDKPAFSQKS